MPFLVRRLVLTGPDHGRALELASSAYFIRLSLTLPGRLVLPVDRPCLEFGYGACGVRSGDILL